MQLSHTTILSRVDDLQPIWTMTTDQRLALVADELATLLEPLRKQRAAQGLSDETVTEG